jgi:hypothetical protein
MGLIFVGLMSSSDIPVPQVHLAMGHTETSWPSPSSSYSGTLLPQSQWSLHLHNLLEHAYVFGLFLHLPVGSMGPIPHSHFSDEKAQAKWLSDSVLWCMLPQLPWPLDTHASSHCQGCCQAPQWGNPSLRLFFSEPALRPEFAGRHKALPTVRSLEQPRHLIT